jgi:hypothetical protein
MHFPLKVKSFFYAAIHTEIGDGRSTLFWEDRYIQGRNVKDLVPRLLAAVPRRIQNSRTVHAALTNISWLNDIKGALTVEVLADFLELWDAILIVNLYPDREDKHIFRFAHNGKYSAKAAYESLFIGSTYFEHCERICHVYGFGTPGAPPPPPPKCKIFLWFAALQRCWTSDRLQRRGLDHPDPCPLCDQEPETIDHLLIGCVLARNYWFRLLGQVDRLTSRISLLKCKKRLPCYGGKVVISCKELPGKGLTRLLVLVSGSCGITEMAVFSMVFLPVLM